MGFPEFKLEKRVLDRRLSIMKAEGVVFRTSANIGRGVPARSLLRDFDGLVLAGGAGQPRDLAIPGRELRGIHFAMEYLTQQNRICEGETVAPDDLITAAGKHVIIIGGGDTGADCLGTTHRQGAASVHQFELLPRPPDERAEDNPWPLCRRFSACPRRTRRAANASTPFRQCASMALMRAACARCARSRSGAGARERPDGLQTGPRYRVRHPRRSSAAGDGLCRRGAGGVLTELGVKMTERGTVWRDHNWMTSVPGVFTAGDMQRGQSLIVWAIAEGRSCARGVDQD